MAGIAWLRFGIDMPWFDDWRGYVDGNIHSLEINYLFRAINDTLAPVGFALDALAQRYLDGNSIAYQLISMFCVLGGLAWLQWKLLIRSLGSRLQASTCFLFVVFMLQPDSYWGWENLAYHQALPLVFILAAIFLIIFSEKSIKLIGPLIFAAGIFAGFTYISGAVGVLVCGSSLLALSILFFKGVTKNKIMTKSLWFFSAGILTVFCQIYFSLLKNRGVHTGASLALPNEADFWFFYLGKIGRSLLLPQQWVHTSFALTLFFSVVALVVAVILFLKELRSSEDQFQEKRIVMIFISLGAVIAVYLAMISAGRANHRPLEIENLFEVYSYGFHRFHYFWVTLIWPWLVAGIIVLLRNKKFFSNKLFQITIMIFGVFLFFFFMQSDAFAHFKYQKEVAEVRQTTAKCLLESVQKGPEIHCQGLAPPRNNQDIPDSFPGYAYAHKTNASFVRNFPILPMTEYSENGKILFDFSDDVSKFDFVNLDAIFPDYYQSINNDSQILINLKSENLFEKCKVLDIFMKIKIEKDARAQIFFIPINQNEFTEKNSNLINIKSKDQLLQAVVFRIESEKGFSGKFRFDPVDNIQKFTLDKIQGLCRITVG